MALKAVASASTTLDRVSEQLLDQLRTGEWPVGTKLPGETALAEQLQVSRAVVREAIRGLARLGVLDPRHGSGTYVRTTHSPSAMLEGMGRAGAVEVFEVQMAYDVQAAGLAAERRSVGDVRRLRELLARRDRSELDRSAPATFADDDAAFHLEIARMSGNDLLYETYKYFVGRLRDGLHLVQADVSIPSCGHESHAVVVEAIEAGDVGAAREAARALVSMAIAAADTGRGDGANGCAP